MVLKIIDRRLNVLYIKDVREIEVTVGKFDFYHKNSHWLSVDTSDGLRFITYDSTAFLPNIKCVSGVIKDKVELFVERHKKFVAKLKEKEKEKEKQKRIKNENANRS